jgi:hypothetical protein
MPVYVNSTKYSSLLDSTQINWLLANVGDEVVIEHVISVKTFAISSTSTPFVLNNTDGYIPTSGTIWVTGGDFSLFQVGDTIQLANYALGTVVGTLVTIVEKLSATEIRLSSNPVGWTANQTGTQDVFSIATPVTALAYKWNFIENGEATNFQSKVDLTEQLATITGLDPVTSGGGGLMTFIGAKPYQYGRVEVIVDGLNTVPVYSSEFTVIHRTRITPFMLANQWDDILNSIAPDYFFNTNCLRPVYFFEARYNLTDPNNKQSILIDEEIGNTGWFNESWNTGLTNYSISNLAYEDTLSSVSIPSVELKTGNASEFTFKINNATDTPFVAGSTEIELNFAKAPNSETEYQGNLRDLQHNFVWETKALAVQTTPTAVNGDNYSDPTLRSLKGLKATFNSSSQITVTGKIDMLQDAIDVFNESDEPRYMFWVSVQNHSLTGGLSDRVSLLIDASPFYFQTDFPDLLNFTSKLIPHDVENYTDSFTLRDVFTEDELVGYTEIQIDESDKYPTASKSIIRLTGKVVAINTVTNDEFTLQTDTFNVSAIPVTSGYQYFNLSQNINAHVPSTEIRKKMVAYYDVANSVYVFAYPYLNDWSYWLPLQGVDSAFFDVTEPNNGKNRDWRHYNGGNWKLSYVCEVAMKVNGVPAIYKSYTNYFDYDRNLDPASKSDTSCIIKTYDADTLTELVDGTGKKFILGYKNTLVKATFENGNTGFNPIAPTVVIGLEVFEEGGINGKRRMSSKYASDSDTWFIPLTGEIGVKSYNDGIDLNFVYAEVLIDFTKLNLTKNKYKLTARVYGTSIAGSYSGSPYPCLQYSENYLGDQEVYLIPTNPVPTSTTVVTSKDMDCASDFTWKVLADADSNNELRNDKTSFLYWFNKDIISSAELFLVDANGTEISLESESDYGTPYDYGFYENNQGEYLVGYLIDWKKVLEELGECVYYVKCFVTSEFGGTTNLISDNYCIKQYTDARAEGTFRIETYSNGILGLNNDDEKVRDFGTLNWYSQYRFDGIFHYIDSTYVEDEIIYQTGEIRNVEDAQTPEYLAKFKAIPITKLNVIRTEILQADTILFTDYNSKNIDSYYKKRVKKIGDFSPKFNMYFSKLGTLELKFKQAINNLRKFIS